MTNKRLLGGSTMKQEDTKRMILEKSLELFSHYGYDAVSVAEIAKAVGIKAPSLYSHFAGKQAIFDAIVAMTQEEYEKGTQDLAVHVESAEKDFSVFTNITEDDLVKKVRDIFSYSLHDQTVSSFRRMMTIEQFRSAQLAELYTKRYVERLTAYHAAIFANLMDAGVMRRENEETLAMMYVSPVLVLLGVCDRQPEREAECVEKLEKHVRMFFRLVQV